MFFYYEPHFNDGTATWDDATYNKISGDSSTNFASGYKNKSIGGNTIRFKFLQFATESIGGSSSGWNVKQYDMHYVRPSIGIVDLADVVARSMEWDIGSTGYTYGTWINYDASNYGYVGSAKYTANADYDLKSGSSLPAGEVKWYKDPTSLPKGTRLW